MSGSLTERFSALSHVAESIPGALQSAASRPGQAWRCGSGSQMVTSSAV
jgi:hypothetical protein